MQRLVDFIQSLGDSNMIFFTLDLQSGFFQVELEESLLLVTQVNSYSNVWHKVYIIHVLPFKG